MSAGELSAGLGWMSWLALGVPTVMLVAIAAFFRRGSKLKSSQASPATDTDLRRLRFDQAQSRPRQRRMAVVDRSTEIVPAIVARPGLNAANEPEPIGLTRRPGLTNRWKGDHRIAIHR
jgi:hypothetical protein